MSEERNVLKGAHSASDAVKGAFSASDALNAPFSTTPDGTTPDEQPEPKPPAKDPMKSFRGVMAGTLIMEGITVALALPVINKFSGGIGTVQGWSLVGISLALVLTCGVLKRGFAIPVVLVLQLVLVAFFFVSTAVSLLGLLFLALWLWLLWLRHDVAKRMAEGRLPSQQPQQL